MWERPFLRASPKCSTSGPAPPSNGIPSLMGNGWGPMSVVGYCGPAGLRLAVLRPRQGLVHPIHES